MKNISFLIGLLFITNVYSQTGNQYNQKVDMLIFTAHPDDEGVFGGVLTDYAICMGKNIVIVCLTSGEWGNSMPHPVAEGKEPHCSYDSTFYPCYKILKKEQLKYPSYYRETEMDCATKGNGIKFPVVYMHLKDSGAIQPWGVVDGGYKVWGGKEKVLEAITSQIRRFKPDVVLSLEWEGENGNPQHMAVSNGVVLASELADDASKFPEQMHAYSAWKPKKVYLHVKDTAKADNKPFLVHTSNHTCAGLNNVSVFQNACNAYSCHICQEFNNPEHIQKVLKSTTFYKLRNSTVGNDSEINGSFFQNIK